MALQYLYNQDKLVAGFVAAMIPRLAGRGFGPCRAIGICSNNELIAGVVLHELSPSAGTMAMSAAALPGRTWITRDTLRLFAYPFEQCGCQMLVNHVPASDQRQQRMLGALNYQFVRVPRWFGRHEDAVFALLTKEDWLASKLCQRAFRDVQNRKVA